MPNKPTGQSDLTGLILPALEQLKLAQANAKAHAIVAVARGRLIKPSICTKCAQPSDTIEIHHEDFSTPMAVTFLCRGCRVKRLRQIRRDLHARTGRGAISPESRECREIAHGGRSVKIPTDQRLVLRTPKMRYRQREHRANIQQMRERFPGCRIYNVAQAVIIDSCRWRLDDLVAENEARHHVPGKTPELSKHVRVV